MEGPLASGYEGDCLDGGGSQTRCSHYLRHCFYIYIIHVNVTLF